MPVVSGLGEAADAVNAARKTADVVDDLHDAHKAIDNTMEIADGVHDAGKASKTYVLDSTVSVCFIAGTLVHTAEGHRPIEEVKTGQLVWAWDEVSNTVALKKVVETYINQTSDLIHLLVNGEKITTTPNHPFYSPVKGWTSAVHLRAGDILVTVNRELVIVEKIQHEILESPITVYNFQVEGYHTYFVSNISVLVHNASCGSNRITNISRAESKIWKNLTPAKKGLRTSGSGRNKLWYSWDDCHNEIEVFDRFGNHIGVLDPNTGKWIKGAVKGRNIKI